MRTFEENNQAFLKAALEWLRLLLQWSATHASAKERGESVDQLQVAKLAMREAAKADPKPSFMVLAERFGLSEFDQGLLLLAATMELDPGLPSLISAFYEDANQRFPTLALALAIFEAEKREFDALSPRRPLRRFQLVEVHQSGGAPLLTANLRIDERIAGLIKGEPNDLDERLLSFMTPLPEAPSLPTSQTAVAEAMARWLALESPTGIVQLVGGDRVSKRGVMAASAALTGRRAYAITVDTLPSGADEFEAFARLWQRESRLLPLIMYLEEIEATTTVLADDRTVTRLNPRLRRNLRRITEAIVLDARTPIAELEDASILEILPPTELERRELWSREFETRGINAPVASVDRLASEFTLAPSRIRERAEQALYGVVDSGQSGQECVERAWQVCISRGLADLEGLAERIKPRARLEDVKLPAHGQAELERLVQHALHRFKVSLDFGFGGRTNRGLGLAALFHGESGTGKTMAAEAVAAALGLPLLRADMASLLSKYYGETEKNIRRLFDIAAAGGAVCLFDECDSIGSRRVDASDSRDQFLNVQINYLLTRMDSFTGVAILATNMKQALDPAFLRRTRYVIEFPFPGTSERKAIWQSVFPSATPLGRLDFDRLSLFALSGANIHNVALAAAHTAAANRTPRRCAVEMPHILESIRAELIKIGRPGTSSEFQWTLDPAESTQEEAA